MSRQPQPIFASRPLRSKMRFNLLIVVVVILAIVGCVDSSTDDESFKEFKKAAPDPLTVLVIGETSIGPKLERQWKSRMDGKLTVVDMLESDWIKNEFQIAPEVDLIIYPTTFIGELTEAGKIMELGHPIWSSDEIDKGSYLDHYGRSIVRHGNKPMAVPLGNPHFAMLFDRSKFNKLASQGEVLGDLPATWSELDVSIEKLNGKIALPLAEGWAGHALTCRVAPSVRAVGSFSVLFDRATMKPKVSSPPFVEALESLKKIASKSALDSTPSQTFRAVMGGDAVAALGWPAKSNESDADLATRPEEERGSLEITTVPGASRVYDFRRSQWKNRTSNDDQWVDLIGVSGLVASMISDNQHEYSAIEFLKWVSDQKIILSVTTDSPKSGPVRVSHLGNIGKWTGESVSLDLADDYAAVVRTVHKRNLVVLFPRIPGSHLYYKALDAGVRSAVSGKQTPQDALDAVADQWEEITESIGRKEQIQAMRRESGF